MYFNTDHSNITPSNFEPAQTGSSKPIPSEQKVALSPDDQFKLDISFIETSKKELSKLENITDKNIFISTASMLKSKENEVFMHTSDNLKLQLPFITEQVEKQNKPLQEELTVLQKEPLLNKDKIDELTLKIGNNNSQLAALNLKIETIDLNAQKRLLDLIHETSLSLIRINTYSNDNSTNDNFTPPELHELYKITLSLAKKLPFISPDLQFEFNNKLIELIKVFPEKAKTAPPEEPKAALPEEPKTLPPEEPKTAAQESGWGSGAWNVLTAIKNTAYNNIPNGTSLANVTNYAANYIPDASIVSNVTNMIPSFSLPTLFSAPPEASKSSPPAKVINQINPASSAELIQKNIEAAMNLMNYINEHESFFSAKGIFREQGENKDINTIQDNVLRSPQIDLKTLEETIGESKVPLDALPLATVLKRRIEGAKLFSEPELQKSISEFAANIPRSSEKISGTSLTVADEVSPEQINLLKKLILQLPDDQKNILKTYFGLLKKVVQNSDVNLMTAPKIAPMVGPRLFEIPFGTLAEIQAQTDNKNVLSQVLIRHYDELFS